MNLKAVETMGEDDIDISGQTSDTITEYHNMEFDFVITVCDHAKENCPYFPVKDKAFHQDFQDPAKASGTEEDIREQFRTIRNQIKDYCSQFVKENL